MVVPDIGEVGNHDSCLMSRNTMCFIPILRSVDLKNGFVLYLSFFTHLIIEVSSIQTLTVPFRIY